MTDRKYLIVVAGVGVNFFVWGFSYSLGIYTEVFLRHFHLSNSKASLFMAFLMSALVAVSPLNLFIIRRFGCRNATLVGSLIAAICPMLCSAFHSSYWTVVFFLGVTMGVAMNLSFIGCILVVPQFFKRTEHQWVFAVMAVGSSLGNFAFPWIHSELLRSYSWQHSLLVNGAILLHLVPCCMLLPRKLNDTCKSTDEINIEKLSSADVRRPLYANPVYVVLAGAHVVVFVFVATFWTFVYPLLTIEYNYTRGQCVHLMLLMGLMTLVGQLLLSCSHLLFRLDVVHYVSLVSVLFALCVALLSVLGSMTEVAVVTVAIGGVAHGMMWSLLPSAVAHVVTPNQFPSAFSLSQLLLGFGSLTGPFLLASLMDRLRSYVLPMLLGAVMHAAVFTLLSVVKCVCSVNSAGV